MVTNVVRKAGTNVRTHWLVWALIGSVLAWWAGTFAVLYAVDRGTASDCTGMQPVPTANELELDADPDAAVLTGPETTPKVNFTTLRDAQTVTIPLAVEGELPADPADVEVVIEGFRNEDGAPDLGEAFRVREVGNHLVVDLCIDSRPLEVTDGETTDRKESESFFAWLFGTSETRPGTYESDIHVRGEGISAEPIPVEVRFQGRYLWLLVPTIWLMPILAVWLIYEVWPKPFRKLAIVVVPTIGVAAVAFNAQGLSDPDWGGTAAFFGLIGATFGAATAAVTLAAKTPTRGGQAEVEEAEVEVEEVEEVEVDEAEVPPPPK